MRADALRPNVLRSFDLEPECVAIEDERSRKILDSDADVVENGFHDLDSRAMIPAAAVYGSSSLAAMRSTIASNSRGDSWFSACVTRRRDSSSRNLASLLARRRSARDPRDLVAPSFFETCSRKSSMA